MEKSDVQKLIDTNSDRASVVMSKQGKSAVWRQFAHVSVDGTAVPFVKCIKCCSVLQWKSRDGTSGLHAHVEYCKSRAAQPKISGVPGFVGRPKSPKLPSGLKSDVADTIVRWCAKDIRLVKLFLKATSNIYNLISIYLTCSF
jgi:hypothetical protein